MRKLLALCTSALLGLSLAVGGATAASADSHFTDNDGKICAALDSGKIDTTGDPETVTVMAPEGMLIDGYCVKAGSAESGDGPVWVPVEPPQKTVIIDHPDKDSVSHYSLSYVDNPEEEVTNPKADAKVKCEDAAIKVHLSNMGEGVNTAVEFKVYLGDELQETVIVAAGEDAWVKLEGLTEDASYHVIVKADGEKIFHEILVFDCEGEEEEKTNPEADAWLKCEVDAIKVYLSNKGEGVNTAVEFKVYLGEELQETVTVEAGEDAWVKLDGLTEDAAYHVIVKVGEEKIYHEKFIFDCEGEQEMNNPEADAWLKCEKEAIVVYLSNMGEGVNAAAEFKVYLGEELFDTVRVEAGEDAWVKIGDLTEDAAYHVIVKVGEEKIYHEKFVFDCEGEQEMNNPEADAWVKCEADGIKVYLSNMGEGVNVATEFKIYVNDTLFKTVSVEAGGDEWVKIGDLTEDATYWITVKADGNKIFHEKFVFDCEPELPTLPWTGADTDAGGLLAGGLLLLGAAGLYLQRRMRPLAESSMVDAE